VLGLGEAVVDGIVEALRVLAVVVGSQAVLGRERNVYTAGHGRVGLAAPCANEICGNGLRLRHEGGAREQQCGFERDHVAWAWRACESVCVYERMRVYGGGAVKEVAVAAAVAGAVAGGVGGESGVGEVEGAGSGIGGCVPASRIAKEAAIDRDPPTAALSGRSPAPAST
jgi:hypothetical protein